MEFLGPDQALMGIAPMIIAGIISAVSSMAAAEKAKQGQQAAASGQAAAAGGEAAGGIDMKPSDLIAGLADGKKNQSYVGDGADITKAALSGAPPVNLAPQTAAPVGAPALPEGGPTKINAEILAADGQTAPPPQGPSLGTSFPGDVGPMPQEEAISAPDPSKMSKEEKMAMAASIGSLLRGPGAPPPPSAPSGGQGINMQPVFLKDLR